MYTTFEQVAAFVTDLGFPRVLTAPLVQIFCNRTYVNPKNYSFWAASASALMSPVPSTWRPTILILVPTPPEGVVMPA